jgi:hypothetical protein
MNELDDEEADLPNRALRFLSTEAPLLSSSHVAPPSSLSTRVS